MTDPSRPPMIVMLPIVPPIENVRAHGLEFCTSVAAVFIGIVFFADPHSVDRTPIGEAVHPLDWCWNGMYVLGGLMTVIGLLLDHRIVARRLAGTSIELAGLLLLVPAYLAEILTNLHLGVVTTFGVIIRASIMLGLVNRAWGVVASRKAYVPVAVAQPPTRARHP
jgi:hypothetical protein